MAVLLDNFQEKQKVHQEEVRSLPWLKRIFQKKAYLFAESERLTALLKQKRWSHPAYIVQDPLIEQVASFLKKNKGLKDPRMKACQEELIAVKCGLCAEVFSWPQCKDLLPFLQKSALHNYLRIYNKTLLVDQESKSISLPTKEGAVPWHAVADKVREWMNESQPWFFGKDGFHYKSMYRWEKLKPYKVEDPQDWGKRYLAEYCITCKSPGKIQLQGDHAWLRLRTPKGKVYSVGLYRPEKRRGFLQNFKAPFSAKRGYLMQPDVSEFYPFPIHSLKIGITKEQFDRIVKALEEDKAKEEELIFSLFGKNCAQYVQKKLELAGACFPYAICAWECLCAPPLRASIQKTFLQGGWKEKVGKVLFTYFWVPFGNIILWILGASKVEKEVEGHLPHLQTFVDLTKKEKLDFVPPSFVPENVFDDVERWRQKERQQDFSLPPKYRFL